MAALSAWALPGPTSTLPWSGATSFIPQAQAQPHPCAGNDNVNGAETVARRRIRALNQRGPSCFDFDYYLKVCFPPGALEPADSRLISCAVLAARPPARLPAPARPPARLLACGAHSTGTSRRRQIWCCWRRAAAGQ
jgi:hypothetical protein